MVLDLWVYDKFAWKFWGKCFWTALAYRFKYIAILDIDEVIVPQKHDNWAAMMEDLVNASNPNTIGWHFRHVYFLDGMTKDMDKAHVVEEDMKGKIPAPISDIPEHLHIFNHIFRSANHSPGEVLQ